LHAANGRCQITADFSSPPPGLTSNTKCISVSLKADYRRPGLPIGVIVEKFAQSTLDALNIGSNIPPGISDVNALLQTITIDEARIAFLKISDS
jgi:hypothetical protein